VNKSQLVTRVATRLGLSQHRAQGLVEVVLDGIVEGLREDQAVTISGFGTFEVKARKARLGRNPHTGAPIQIQAGRRVGFRVGRALKASV
jgi:DNA-binding protein HU-beta